MRLNSRDLGDSCLRIQIGRRCVRVLTRWILPCCRNHFEQQRLEFDRKFLAMDDTLARKEEENLRLKQEIIALSEHQREGDLVKNDLHKLYPFHLRSLSSIVETSNFLAHAS